MMKEVFAATVLLAVGSHAALSVDCGLYKVQNGESHNFACESFGAVMAPYSVTIAVTTPGFLCKGAMLSTTVGGHSTGMHYVYNGDTLTLDVHTYGITSDYVRVTVTNDETTCDASTTVTMYYTDVPTTPSPPPSPDTPRPVPATPRPVPYTPLPPPGQLCPMNVGNGEVAVTSCGQAACRATQHLPLGEQFEMCDPCVAGPLGVLATIERSGSDYVVQWHKGDMTGSATIECGKCITIMDNSAIAACQSSGSRSDGGGLSAGAIAGIVIGVLVSIAAVGGGVFLWRRNAARSAGNAYEGSPLVH